MKAITCRQPWADCIASGAKTVENRGRVSSFRGEVAIHASKTTDLLGDTDPRVLGLLGAGPRAGVPLGAIVAVAEVVDCHLAQWPADVTCCSPWGDRYYNGFPAYHLVFGNIRALSSPVYCRGALMIGWQVPVDVEVQVRAALDGGL